MMQKTKTRRYPAATTVAALLLFLVLLAGCDTVEEGGEDQVDLERLFAAPTSAEVQAVLDEWQGRDPAVQDFEVEAESSLVMGSILGNPGVRVDVRVVSHTVGGVRHYGAIVVPEGAPAGELPVLVYTHGGDAGVDLEELGLILAGMGEVADEFVYVVPSFRSEPLVFGEQRFKSGGAPSPWDRDVDDALALLNAALAETPAADPERIGVLGLSRGAGVGLLMAARDPRIDRVVEFFGPTDFFGPYVQEVVEESLAGNPRDLPGLNYLDAEFIQPLAQGGLTIEEVRPELVRRSAVLFADRLPPVQIHHGTADDIVAFGQAEALRDALEAADRPFEFYSYPGGHDPFSLTGSTARAVAFVSELLETTAA